jgi:hypothetical protein
VHTLSPFSSPSPSSQAMSSSQTHTATHAHISMVFSSSLHELLPSKVPVHIPHRLSRLAPRTSSAPSLCPTTNTSPIKPRDRCSQPRCCAILRSRPTPHSQSPQLPSATTGSRTPSLNPTVLLHAAPRPGYPDMHATVHNLKPRVPGAPCRRRRCVAVHRWWRIFPAAVPRLKALLNVRPRRAAR